MVKYIEGKKHVALHKVARTRYFIRWPAWLQGWMFSGAFRNSTLLSLAGTSHPCDLIEPFYWELDFSKTKKNEGVVEVSRPSPLF